MTGRGGAPQCPGGDAQAGGLRAEHGGSGWKGRATEEGQHAPPRTPAAPPVAGLRAPARALQRDSPHVAGTAGRPPCPAGVEETNVGLCRGDGGVSHAIVPRLEGVA